MTTKTDDLVNIFMQEDGDKFWGPKRVYPTAADFVCALRKTWGFRPSESKSRNGTARLRRAE